MFRCTLHLIIIFIVKTATAQQPVKEYPYNIKNGITSYGAVIRGDTTQKKLSIVFTAHDFNDGKKKVSKTLKHYKIKAAFFLTGYFYQQPGNRSFIKKMVKRGHYLGPHSDAHLLYADWGKRDSLLLSYTTFETDLLNNYKKMEQLGITKETTPYFMPPYEWYNTTIAGWCRQLGVKLINFTPGTGSNADYTYPEMGKSYKSSADIYNRILSFEEQKNLNGFILLVHLGTDPRRTDKFYNYLPALINEVKKRGYKWVPLTELLKENN